MNEKINNKEKLNFVNRTSVGVLYEYYIIVMKPLPWGHVQTTWTNEGGKGVAQMTTTLNNSYLIKVSSVHIGGRRAHWRQFYIGVIKIICKKFLISPKSGQIYSRGHEN